MKIQLDYDKKEITLESNVDLGKFINRIQAILPDYNKWTLNTTSTVVWTYPNYINCSKPGPWWEQPSVVYRSGDFNVGPYTATLSNDQSTTLYRANTTDTFTTGYSQVLENGEYNFDKEPTTGCFLLEI